METGAVRRRSNRLMLYACIYMYIYIRIIYTVYIYGQSRVGQAKVSGLRSQISVLRARLRRGRREEQAGRREGASTVGYV